MIRAAAIVALAAGPETAAPQEDGFREEALAALRKAVRFYRTRVARHGGYVYYTSLDLAERWGEGKAEPDQIWVQPPGTPTVGTAYWAAWEATKEDLFLEAAREAAEALVRGQLESGGWTNLIDFSPAGGRRAGKYRAAGGGWNVSSLDDGQTPAALRFLIRMDRALEFRHEKIHDAALYGLDALLKAQFPNGGFPQVWTGPVPARPVAPAGYPDYDWKTERRVKNYWDLYTLNDGIAGHVFRVLAEARATYGEDRFTAAIRKLGDFLILAQMPDPQPAWAQQYTEEMRPAWARKFEPPALASRESQDAIETLVEISRQLGEARYLAPVPRALQYLKECY
ncbi:MAG: pectate lyase [Planctomycetota bacterium]